MTADMAVSVCASSLNSNCPKSDMAVKVSGALSENYYCVADDVGRMVETPAKPTETSWECGTLISDEANVTGILLA